MVMKQITDETGKVDFVQHMKDKAEMWGVYQVRIGKDFAVFEFDTKEIRNEKLSSLQHYEKIYGYTSYTGPREQIAVVKGKIK